MAMHDLTCTHARPQYSRHHYEEIADALNRTVRNYGLVQVNTRFRNPVFYHTVDSLCLMFLKDNHLFDRVKFIARKIKNIIRNN